jgi:tRNA (adenine22-N1)-methyltransferase
MKRLAAIAAMVSRGGTAADIGADHALLALLLIKNNIASRVIVSEIADKPYQRALNTVQESGLHTCIEVRRGNGLEVLQPAEVDTVIIAGMGGDTIAAILARDWDRSGSFGRYVLQPMSKSKVLRQTLADRGWPLLDEKLVEENGHIFEIIASCPGAIPYRLTDLEAELGPGILKNDEEIKNKFLQRHIKKYQNIYDNLLNHSDSAAEHLVWECYDKIKKLEAIINACQS